MRRYRFLTKEDIFEALNRLRDAFLAAEDGNEVNEIIHGLLTRDERLKIGRRIIIAEYILSGRSIEETGRELKVGKNTVVSIMRNLEEHPQTFELINKRSEKVKKEYSTKKYRLVGGSTLINKRREYTGFKRSDVKR